MKAQQSKDLTFSIIEQLDGLSIADALAMLQSAKHEIQSLHKVDCSTSAFTTEKNTPWTDKARARIDP